MEIKSLVTIRKKIKELEHQLTEAKDTIEAIRMGQIDALVVNSKEGHRLYTLETADVAYRVFIEKMTEGAVSLNSSGTIIYSNSKFASMVESPLAKVIGSTFVDFIAEDERSTFLNVFSKEWTEDGKREISLRARGTKIPVQLSINSLDLDVETSLNIIITDLTFQKSTQKILKEKNEQLEALNEALARSNDDLQQFASVASHDLQEPLRKIQVFSQFLKDRSFGELSDAAKQYVEKIILSANRMKTLIVDILTYSRLSAEESNFESVRLRSICEEIIEDFDLCISEKKAVIELGDLPSVDANKGQLRQVFNNLISNALKFTTPGVHPLITIQAKKINAAELGLSLPEEERYCRVSIKDNGIGFDERYAASIFSLFEKLNPKSSYEGSGIGLAIAKKIIDKHQGIIIAKSNEGAGSEFNIILPLKQ
ncbi:MAG: ATP-binding protein [Cyclobacteriaceae bacterium]